MSFIEKIKRLFEENKPEKKKEIAVSSMKEFSDKINEEEAELRKRNEVLISQIKLLISNFSEEVDKAVKSIEEIDLKERKEHERVKEIVQQNLALYVSHLKRLKDNLKNLEKTDVEGYLNSVFQKINEFGRISHASFEKATFLIGKQMADAKSKVKILSENVKSVVEKNRSLLERNVSVNKIKSLMNELQTLESQIEKSKNEHSALEARLSILKKECEKIEKDIYEIKNSEELRKEKEEIRKNNEESEILEREVYAVKQKINFKELARQFHPNKKMSQIIKDYGNDFKTSLMSEKDEEIISLFGVEGLKELQKKLVDFKPVKSKKGDEISELDEKLAGVKSNIDALESGINLERNKQEKIRKNILEVVNAVKEEAKSVSIFLNE